MTGGQGIGRGIALALAGESAAVTETVTLTGRTLAKLGEVVKEITAIGGRALAASGDAGSRGYVADWVDATVTEFGTVDILVNNAQSPVRRSLEKTTDADIETAFGSGTLSTFYPMQACLPYLKRRGGSIVNFAAVIGETPLGRLGDPEADIGRAVAALVSDDLKYPTGATLLLDGGRTITTNLVT